MNFGTEDEKLRFEGNFKEGKRHGFGTLRKGDEIIVQGEWQDDKFAEESKTGGDKREGLDPSKSFEEFDRAFRESSGKTEISGTENGKGNIIKFQGDLLIDEWGFSSLTYSGQSATMCIPDYSNGTQALFNVSSFLFNQKLKSLKTTFLSKSQGSFIKKKLRWFAVPASLKYFFDL